MTATINDIDQFELIYTLAESGHEFVRDEDDANRWRAAVNDPRVGRIDLVAEMRPDGVQLQAAAASWKTGLTKKSKAAVDLYLPAAQRQLGGVKLKAEDTTAFAEATAAADKLDSELPAAIQAVVAACRQTRRELGALADPHLAAVYIETQERN